MRMKVSLAAVLLLTMLSVAFVSFCEDIYADDEPPSEEPEEVPITILHGYVYELPVQENKKPLAGVTVTTWMNTEKDYETYVTKDDGWFELKYNKDIRFVSFSLTEYTVQDWWHELYKSGNSGFYEIKLDSETGPTEIHDLFGDSLNTVLMARTNASIFGTVTSTIDGRSEAISGARITLISDKASLSAISDDGGYFSVNCASGVKYQMEVSKGGFLDWSLDEVDPASGLPVAVHLIQKDHTYAFGMDLTHSLALLGVLVIVLIGLVGVYMAKRPEKEDGIYILNDIPARKSKGKE